ncbi:MAG: hypothetical protein ACRCST_13680 [Turicibacter sp.]
MPTISGYLYFNADRKFSVKVGIANIPIILQNTVTNEGVVALTKTSGDFSFTNVPSGSYRLVEAFGTLGGRISPVDFSLFKTILSTPIPKDPPISSVPTRPTGTTRIDSISPNTIFLTVSTSNIANLLFYDGPVVDVPIALNDVIPSTNNLITAALSGRFLQNPPGTVVNTSPIVNPYGDVLTGPNNVAAPRFKYIQYLGNNTPNDGYLSLVNINTNNTFGVWWNLTNKFPGDETGGFEIVNGANTGSIFFQQLTSIASNTNYYFSTWICNLCRAPNSLVPPKLGILIQDLSGNTVFQTVLTAIPSTTVPTWNEVGTFFNTGPDTTLKISFYSAGPAAAGNDFAISNISLVPVVPKPILTISLTQNKEIANISDEITYTYTIANTGASVARNIILTNEFKSLLPFVSGSISINGISMPQLAFTQNQLTISDITGGGSTQISFNVKTLNVPPINPTLTTGYLTYSFSPIAGGAGIAMSTQSNTVSTKILNAHLETTLTTSQSEVGLNDLITYAVHITNTGDVAVGNSTFTTNLSASLRFVEGSISSPYTGNLTSGINIGNLAVNEIKTFTFQARVISIPPQNPVQTTGLMMYEYSTAALVPQIRTVSTATSTATTQINYLTLSAILSADKLSLPICEILTYCLVLTNTGNISANQLVLTDIFPYNTSYVDQSLTVDGVIYTGNPSNGIPIGTIRSNETKLIYFKVQVMRVPIPNLMNNYASVSYSYVVNPQVGESLVGSIQSNTLSTLVLFHTSLT